MTFKVRSFGTTLSGETWNFGDGSPPENVFSDANSDPHAPQGYAETIHRFEKPGHYLVRVDHQANNGGVYTARLHVHVEEGSPVTVASSDDVAILQHWLDRKLLPTDEAGNMMRAFVEKQIEPLPLPQTLGDWRNQQETLRKEIPRILGIDDLVPPTWDLNLTTQGTIQHDGYRIEKLTYETYPGFANAALLHIPENVLGKAPGIVSISGHTSISKAADYVQQRNVNLVRRGCVVLSYDYFGYGDRKTGNQPDYPEGANGHGIRSFSYSRRSATALEVLDAIRALDVLTQRPEVDTDRIGFTGESGGSNTTYWTAALDPRVKLAVPVSSVTTFDYWIRGDINWDWHQRPPGIRRVADIGTLLALHAPHPLLIISSKRGTDDAEFPWQEAEKSYRWAKHVYGLYGAAEHVDHYESTSEHGYQQDKRQELYRAVERWLSPPFPHDGRELPATLDSPDDLSIPLPENNQTFRGIFANGSSPCRESAPVTIRTRSASTSANDWVCPSSTPNRSGNSSLAKSLATGSNSGSLKPSQVPSRCSQLTDLGSVVDVTYLCRKTLQRPASGSMVRSPPLFHNIISSMVRRCAPHSCGQAETNRAKSPSTWTLGQPYGQQPSAC